MDGVLEWTAENGGGKITTIMARKLGRVPEGSGQIIAQIRKGVSEGSGHWSGRSVPLELQDGET